MNYLIRKGTSSDLPQIQILLTSLYEKEHEEFDDTIDPFFVTSIRGRDYLRQRLEDDVKSFCLVAEDAGNMVGCFVGGVHMPEIYRAQIPFGEGENIFIKSEYRSRGIGTEFLRLFEEWCKNKGVARVRVVASSKNERALALYTKLGFETFDVTLEKIL